MALRIKSAQVMNGRGLDIPTHKFDAERYAMTLSETGILNVVDTYRGSERFGARYTIVGELRIVWEEYEPPQPEEKPKR